MGFCHKIELLKSSTQKFWLVMNGIGKVLECVDFFKFQLWHFRVHLKKFRLPFQSVLHKLFYRELLFSAIRFLKRTQKTTSIGWILFFYWINFLSIYKWIIGNIWRSNFINSLWIRVLLICRIYRWMWSHK